MVFVLLLESFIRVESCEILLSCCSLLYIIKSSLNYVLWRICKLECVYFTHPISATSFCSKLVTVHILKKSFFKYTPSAVALLQSHWHGWGWTHSRKDLLAKLSKKVEAEGSRLKVRGLFCDMIQVVTRGAKCWSQPTRTCTTRSKQQQLGEEAAKAVLCNRNVYCYYILNISPTDATTVFFSIIKNQTSLIQHNVFFFLSRNPQKFQQQEQYLKWPIK